jgi:hypothetical protein
MSRTDKRRAAILKLDATSNDVSSSSLTTHGILVISMDQPA